jgi:hypothetical protein
MRFVSAKRPWIDNDVDIANDVGMIFGNFNLYFMGGCESQGAKVIIVVICAGGNCLLFYF